jgi:hypothetical protein
MVGIAFPPIYINNKKMTVYFFASLGPQNNSACAARSNSQWLPIIESLARSFDAKPLFFGYKFFAVMRPGVLHVEIGEYLRLPLF